MRHLSLLSLNNTLGNPNNVADLLLFQLEVRVKHTVTELLQETEFVQLHFVLKESFFETLVFRVLNIGQQVAVSLFVRNGQIEISVWNWMKSNNYLQQRFQDCCGPVQRHLTS